MSIAISRPSVTLASSPSTGVALAWPHARFDCRLGTTRVLSICGAGGDVYKVESDVRYGKAVESDLPFAKAIERATQLLNDEGFGILCQIDVEKAFREKTGAEFRPYVILGACNPVLAHTALSAEDQLGLLLPCNVVVQERDGKTIISAVDARQMLDLVGNPALDEVAADANARFQRVLDALTAS